MQQERAQRFASLHVKGNPLVLYNAWDAGSAQAIARAGAPAIATSSWAVAAAQGYDDGQAMPWSLVEQMIARIVRSVELPVTVDVEGAYSDDPGVCATNVARLVDLGVVGINFEDRIVSGTGLHAVSAHAERIAAIRRMAEQRGVSLFINARTDVFFGAPTSLEAGVDAVTKRARAYADAGASGLFVPGLVDPESTAQLCRTVDLPVNVMVMPGLPDAPAMASAGVARISHGPGPFLGAMEAVRVAALAAFASE